MSDTPAGVQELKLSHFRCFDAVDLAPASAANLVIGGNASGKTSLLEALFLLGRGTSFRAARPDAAIRFGSPGLTAFGRLGWEPPPHRVGVEVSRKDGLTVRVDGQAGGRADLARALPVQVLDPASHELVQGPPAGRRQFLDWGVFHVEHAYQGAWQRYRRALQQRNAALRQGAGTSAWAWDEALAEAGVVMDRCRRDVLALMLPIVTPLTVALLDEEPELRYLPGWSDEESLIEALGRARDRDLAMGSTQVGPHRADLRIAIRSRRARETVSRGQEKLLVAALTLGQVAMVADTVKNRVVLLVDEPGADLDRVRLARFEQAVWGSPAQVFLTALEVGTFTVPAGGRVFHVEHGTAQALI